MTRIFLVNAIQTTLAPNDDIVWADFLIDDRIFIICIYYLIIGDHASDVADPE